MASQATSFTCIIGSVPQNGAIINKIVPLTIESKSEKAAMRSATRAEIPDGVGWRRLEKIIQST